MRGLRVPLCTLTRLKSSVNAPTPCANISTRSPPDVLLPSVLYVRLRTDPSAKRNDATRLFCPIGSAFPVGNEYADTLTGSESSSQYMRSMKWQASPRMAPPMAGAAIHLDTFQIRRANVCTP